MDNKEALKIIVESINEAVEQEETAQTTETKK